MKFLILALCSLITASHASDLPIKFGGFIDTYYAYDFNNPHDHEREFTTQPVRHNEFNVNMAYFDAVLKQDKTRGRLALQFGQSVTKNSSSEPNQGKTSGSLDAKMFQEAYVGKKMGTKTWIDAGIFLGNIGAESWISKDNWTYTRALNLDYVPYYSAGVRLEHHLNDDQSFQLQILNGWQIMSENNQGKALGGQYKHLITKNIIFTYNNFLGDEKVVPNPRTGKFNSRFRGYHNTILQWMKSDKWHFLTSLDFGHQSQQNNDGIDGWLASTLTIKNILNQLQSVAMRFEYYNDRHQSNVSTSSPNGFQVVGASLNFDQKLDENALWRTELRGFSSKDKIYPTGKNDKNRLDGFLVTSLSMWF